MSADPKVTNDDENERMIDTCYRLMLEAASRDEKRHWHTRMAFYVGQRSPERIAAMEAEKNIGSVR